MKKSVLMVLLLVSLTCGVCPTVMAADLSDLYTPLMAPGQWLYTARGQFFTLWEKGHHGSASFDSFYSNPQYSSMANTLRFAPALNWDVQFGYEHTFSSNYARPTENPSGVVTSYQRYYIDSGNDYALNVRYRRADVEYYFDLLEKRYRTGWTFAGTQTATPSFLNYFHSHFEDIKIGGRMLADTDHPGGSLFSRPLLADGQLSTEWELGYKYGRVNRLGQFYLSNAQHRYYNINTRPHVLPRVTMRYGISSALEMEGGLTYTTPFKYIFDFRQYKDSGLTNFINGTYTLENNVEIPLGLTYRPTSNLEICTNVDYRFLKQSFESWEKAENGSVTNYPSKKLLYYNWKPQIEVNYVTSPDRDVVTHPIEELTKKLLGAHQWAFSANVLRDITSLRKNGANGPLNVADPYNVYHYPLENFVAGTEYAAFFSGNTAGTPANVHPQNYLDLALGMRHGISDNWELGLKVGYRGPSSAHQYSIGDKSNRFLIFKSYYYVDFSTDFNLAVNNMISFRIHFVPDYDTVLDSSISPKSYKEDVRYLEAGISFKRLF